MPEFEIIWAPLSRKWQVWQRQLDQSGCTVETLIGEYTSEGRATHEAGILRGDIPADTEYEAPRRRRWFSLRRPKASQPVEHGPGEPPSAGAQAVEPTQKASDRQAGISEASVAASRDTDFTKWRSELFSRLEQARRSAEMDEVETIRQMLEEALLFVPSAENPQAA